jgi:HTH-type transcriptional regulator/antitoxin HigA
MTPERKLHSDLAVPPGEYLEEVLNELGMTKDELARRMELPTTGLGAVFRGTTLLTSDVAMQLEKVVGVPANIWLGLEAEYRLALACELEEGQVENRG